MKILSIETSCDETAVSLIEASGSFSDAKIDVLGNALFSQVELHAEYGGVYPSLAKREHAKRLVPLFREVLREADCLKTVPQKVPQKLENELRVLLERESELLDQVLKLASETAKPEIDAIAVTYGPGLEPALWVGINFAKALSLIWNIPVIPIDHMEGHIFSSLLDDNFDLGRVSFPSLVLLISGGHTELILMEDWFSYRVLGVTRDDAVGEAFDKVARMLDLPYPGGPEISKLAAGARAKETSDSIKLPRPMINSSDYDFSFSGLKTAVRYDLQKNENISNEVYAVAFENAVTDILIKKTQKAIDEFHAETIILGGGVSANTFIRSAFSKLIEAEYPNAKLYIPSLNLTTDNAVMIAVAGYFRQHTKKIQNVKTLKADGNLSLSE